MKPWKNAENDIKDFIRQANKNFIEAFTDMLSFYAFKDYIDKTNHSEIINLLYSPTRIEYTYTKIALMSNVDARTLLRYRQKQYIPCFYFYLERNEKLKLLSEIAVTDNTK